MKINSKQLHEKAIELCRKHRELEWQIIEVLQQIDRSRSYRNYGAASLFQYCVNLLGLSESTAYHLISVARKAVEVPALADAIQTERISVPKAARLVSKLNRQNATELLTFAEQHSLREIDRQLRPDNKVNLKVSSKLLIKLKRAQAVTAGNLDLESILEKAIEDYLHRHDPIEKAKRSKTSREPSAPTKMSDSIRNRVLQRDKGRCTHVDASGKRCSNERWLHVHHMRPRSEGGGNEMANLTTLCSAHHDLVHQLSLPLEGQVTWLRSPRKTYAPRAELYARTVGAPDGSIGGFSCSPSQREKLHTILGLRRHLKTAQQRFTR